MFHPRLWAREPFKSNKEIVGNDPNPKENRIGVSLPTGHPLHPQSKVCSILPQDVSFLPYLSSPNFYIGILTN
jgi:hypothetical protein